MLSPRQQFLHFLKNGLVGFALLLSFSSHAELDSSIAVIARGMLSCLMVPKLVTLL